MLTFWSAADRLLQRSTPALFQDFKTSTSFSHFGLTIFWGKETRVSIQEFESLYIQPRNVSALFFFSWFAACCFKTNWTAVLSSHSACHKQGCRTVGPKTAEGHSSKLVEYMNDNSACSQQNNIDRHSDSIQTSISSTCYRSIFYYYSKINERMFRVINFMIRSNQPVKNFGLQIEFLDARKAYLTFIKRSICLRF